MKKLTVKKIFKELFKVNAIYYIDTYGDIHKSTSIYHTTELNNCLNLKQAESLLALNQLINVAHYLNDGWKPDWSNTIHNYKYIIAWDTDLDTPYYINNTVSSESLAVFKTKKLAKKAVKILGKKTIKKALILNH